MRVHGHVEVLARGPHRVVPLVVVRRVLPPERRDQDPAAQAVLARPLDLGDGCVRVVQDRREGDTTTALGRDRAELGQPTVVRTRAGEHQLGLHVGRHRQPGAERRRGRARDRVGHREEDLAGDAVGVELLVAVRGVPAAAQPFLVLLFPLARELGIHDPHPVTHRRASGLRTAHRLVERVAVLRVEIVAVLDGREARVAVRRDDQVATHACPLV